MIETILQGAPILAVGLVIAFCVMCVVMLISFAIAWIWDHNSVLGKILTITCIVVAFLIVSYLMGLAVV